MLLPTGMDRHPVQVTLGVDTHADVHVAAAVDQLGRLLGTHSTPTTPAGYAALLSWAEQFGTVGQVGIEGTGSYGAGLARWLRRRGQQVVEVERPKRQPRRRRGKSDPIDAEAATRAVQAGTATGQPKAGDGPIEMIRTLQAVRRSALKARTQTANQLHALVVTAPDALRSELRRQSLSRLVATAAAFRPGLPLATPTAATKLALKSLAVRFQPLCAFQPVRLDSYTSIGRRRRAWLRGRYVRGAGLCLSSRPRHERARPRPAASAVDRG